jgi:peroxiredoxin
VTVRTLKDLDYHDQQCIKYKPGSNSNIYDKVNLRSYILYFYPKDATPGCTTEGQDFRDNHQAFLDANTIIYGVSKDDLTKHEQLLPILTMENRPLPIDSFNSVAV